jgi:hypothetical protein
MFQLTEIEFENLRSQFVTSSWGGRRSLPYAFTENGVAMLSSILNSDRAILVNISIIRIFTRLREVLSNHKDVLLKLEKLEKKVASHDADIQVVFEYLKQLLSPERTSNTKIGFRRKGED